MLICSDFWLNKVKKHGCFKKNSFFIEVCNVKYVYTEKYIQLDEFS